MAHVSGCLECDCCKRTSCCANNCCSCDICLPPERKCCQRLPGQPCPHNMQYVRGEVQGDFLDQDLKREVYCNDEEEERHEEHQL